MSACARFVLTVGKWERVHTFAGRPSRSPGTPPIRSPFVPHPQFPPLDPGEETRDHGSFARSASSGFAAQRQSHHDRVILYIRRWEHEGV